MNYSINKDITYHNDVRISLFLFFYCLESHTVYLIFENKKAQIDSEEGKLSSGYSVHDCVFEDCKGALKWDLFNSRNELKSKQIFDLFNC